MDLFKPRGWRFVGYGVPLRVLALPPPCGPIYCTIDFLTKQIHFSNTTLEHACSAAAVASGM